MGKGKEGLGAGGRRVGDLFGVRGQDRNSPVQEGGRGKEATHVTYGEKADDEENLVLLGELVCSLKEEELRENADGGFKEPGRIDVETSGELLAVE